MKDEEIYLKDWQIMNTRLLIANHAYLRTIIENQAVIIAHLQNIPIVEVTTKIDAIIKENTDNVNKMVSEKIPPYRYP